MKAYNIEIPNVVKFKPLKERSRPIETTDKSEKISKDVLSLLKYWGQVKAIRSEAINRLNQDLFSYIVNSVGRTNIDNQCVIVK